MRCFVRWMFTALLIFIAIPGIAREKHPDSSVPASEAGSQDVMPGVVMVKFKHALQFGESATITGIATLDAIFDHLQVRNMRQLLPNRALQQSLANPVNIESIYTLSYRGDMAPHIAAALISADPNIEYAEPKYIYELFDTPDDPLYSSMDQFAQVLAPQAWDIIQGGQGSAVIAIVDGGTDWDHQDLAANIWSNPGEIPDNGIDDDGNGFIDDVRGWNFANNSNDPTGLPNTPQNAAHGTHVAGTAGAVTDNGVGVASISWNCQIMPLNAASPSADRAIAFGYDGIAYAAANGADVINCSWGGAGSPSRLAQDVITFAHANGALVVAASGNAGSNNDLQPNFPANYQHVLSVGATNKTSDVKAGFSNYGASTDVFAPGVSIYSTVPNDNYASSFSGTSMSSPMAAGLAGLLKTLQPGYSPDQLREQIRVTCDPIDGANPSLTGLLGKGRINALRMLTDFSIPAIRVSDITFTDIGGDGIIDPGESISLTISFINYLANANAVSVTLSESDNFVTLTDNSATFPSLGTNEEQDGAFQFTVDAGAPSGHLIRFYLDVSSGSYSDRELFTLTVTPPVFASHNTGMLQTSITTEGNIGFTGFDGTPGVGFVYNGNGYLFEGGLMIGTGVNTVSDCIRGGDGATQDIDFAPAAGQELGIVNPGGFTTEEGGILLTDSSATSPLGLSILQKSYADNRPENDDFVIFHYTLLNNNATALSNVFAGIFVDWDINATAVDHAGYDATRKMGYAMNNASSPTRLAGIRLLTGNAAVNYRAIHNPNELYDGFTDAEKWNFLSGGVQTQTLSGVDVSTLVSAGPLNIPANGTVEVAFAVVGANSLADLQQHSDNAQTLWDNPTAIEPLTGSLATGFELLQNYPNPFNPTTTIEYALPVSGDVKLTIYNIAGQKVRTLADGTQSTGRYRAVWNGRDDSGNPVASGVYVYQLRSGNNKIIRKMLFLK